MLTNKFSSYLNHKFSRKGYKRIKRKKYNKNHKIKLFHVNKKFISISCLLLIFLTFLFLLYIDFKIRNNLNEISFSDNLINKIFFNKSNFFQINNIPLNHYLIYTDHSNYNDKYYNLCFNLTYLYDSYSYKFNIVEIKYSFAFYDEKNNSIIPSDLAFFYNLHILCQIEDLKTNAIIYSMANVYENKNFYCINYE